MLVAAVVAALDAVRLHALKVIITPLTKIRHLISIAILDPVISNAAAVRIHLLFELNFNNLLNN